MAKPRFQIFLSSTFRDLRAERQAVLDAVLSIGHFPSVSTRPRVRASQVVNKIRTFHILRNRPWSACSRSRLRPSPHSPPAPSIPTSQSRSSCRSPPGGPTDKVAHDLAEALRKPLGDVAVMVAANW